VEIKNSLAIAFEEKYPVTEGHMLVSPLRHTPSFFDLGASEQKACFLLSEQAKERRSCIQTRDSNGVQYWNNEGFNLEVHKGS
jgi:diadenosine tetraphosphate (Ap4A) HIT family hydrolase